MSSIEEKVDQIIHSLSTLNTRIASLESQEPIGPRNSLLDVDDPLAAESVSAEVDGENQARPGRTEHAAPGQTVGGLGPVRLRGESSTTRSRRDIQGDFLIIKDSFQRIRLSLDQKHHETRTGISRSSDPGFNVISKCGQYFETASKWRGTHEP